MPRKRNTSEKKHLAQNRIDMEEYVAMRSGQTVSFYYDAGGQHIWNVEADTVDIIYNEE